MRMITKFRQWRSFFKNWEAPQKGVALIVTLLVMLVLVLLAFSLVLQSQVEYAMSKNDEDAVATLSHAEAGMDWLDRRVKNFAATRPPDFTNFLEGPDQTPSTADDNLVNVRGILDTAGTQTPAAFFSTSNEQTSSLKVTIGGLPYEAFRVGQDTDGDNVWDGPRGLIYMRVEDNYDPGQDLVDTDLRFRGRFISEYPIFVNNSGVQVSNATDQRATGQRTLIARFGPVGSTAIRTDGDLSVSDDGVSVCGECGGVHANGTLTVSDSVHMCGQATAAGGISLDPSATIAGDKGLAPPIYIPVINPYDARYVPETSVFDHSTDTTFPTYVRCPAPSAADPGSSKYFALVFKTDGGKHGQVYKAYWDWTNNNGWRWRLIDERLDNSDDFDAVLDNCGRVVSTSHGGGADLCPSGALGCESGTGFADRAVTDGGTDEFYAFQLHSNYGTVGSCVSDPDVTTTGHDASLGAATYNNDGLTETVNDSHPNIVPLHPTGTMDTTTGDIPLLPSRIQSTAATDGNLDLLIAETLGQNDTVWDIHQRVYAPMYGAILFFYGNLDASGNLNNIRYNDGSDPAAEQALPDSIWRVAYITYGWIDLGGNVRYGPAKDDVYEYVCVAGRDLRMHGNPGGISGNQVCDPLAADCAATSIPAGYEGIYVAHEQIEFSGTPGIEGLIISEERATCVTGINDQLMNMHGAVGVRYDCNDPVDPWASTSVRLNGWEEVQ